MGPVSAWKWWRCSPAGLGVGKDIKAIPAGHELGKVEPIFRKIEAKEIEQWKNKPKANHNDKTWTHAGTLPALP